jgi:dTDP-4-dehydrorhamnose reductase
MEPLELWGGHECTLNRVHNQYRDQTVLSGHQDRLNDIDLFADLGIRAIRYPLFWEKGDSETPLDWSFNDQRFERLRQRGVRIIAGLVHHGAGPRHATLLTERFAPGLASFATAAARRYPWIEAWTPINEPLTTARFSALYGHWYPHERDERLFWIALLNQVDGVRMAMRAIRSVNSDAKLIQTEDLGRTYSTLATSQQAAFDNVRRWMTWDLLFGRVTTDHPMWLHLARMELADRLKAIADDPCPPDVVGINHYVTSDRFLDDRVDLYPAHVVGGNHSMRYADVEAVRVVQPAPPGLQVAMEDAWQRYGTPIALTEVHNACTREEQLRWLHEAWSTTELMRNRGAEIRAVTAWSLLGAFDWNSLLTRTEDYYEPGAFDVRSSLPRRTAMARLIASIARGEEAPKGWRGEGWWRRDIRLTYAPAHPCQNVPLRHGGQARNSAPEPPLLIVGATGTLGRMLAQVCLWRGIHYVLTSRRDFELDDPLAISRALDLYRPWAVVNAAGHVRVDDAEAEEQVCERANATGIVNLAGACAAREIPLVGFSSDLVFDGAKQTPYVEGDAPSPLNAYGRSKYKAEQALAESGSSYLLVRTAAFFSPHDPHNFAAAVVRELSAGKPIRATGCVVSPTYVPDLANAVLDLLFDGETGVWHLANQAERSWAEFARDIARATGLPENLVRQCSASELGWKATRPEYAALSSERALLLPPLDNAIERFASMARTAIVAPPAAVSN